MACERSCLVSSSVQQRRLCASRYITALTDSEEETLSDSEHGVQDRPQDGLYVLLERIDRLRHGTESDKRECLDILLKHREEVRNPSPPPPDSALPLLKGRGPI